MKQTGRVAWVALSVALLIGPITPVAPVQAAQDPLGDSWTSFCETSQAYGKICGTLVRRGDSDTWDAKWANGAVAVFRMFRSDSAVTAERGDPSGASAGASASYSGTMSADYSRISGTVSWISGVGAATGTTGPWEATVVGGVAPTGAPSGPGGDCGDVSPNGGSNAPIQTAAQVPTCPKPNSSPLSALPASDRDLYQQAVSILRSDPDYDSLGHFDNEEWANLATRNNCLTNAMRIRNPDNSELGRPHFEMLVQIDDLESRGEGQLISDLAEQTVLSNKLNGLAKNLQAFLTVVQEFSWWGLVKTFGTIGFQQLIAQPLGESFTTHAFNRLYLGDKNFIGFKPQWEKWGSAGEAIAHMVEEGTLVEGGSLWSDWKSARVFFEKLNATAQLGWSNETINDQVGMYLEQRYITDTGEIYAKEWRVAVNKPADAMENTLRDALHDMKLQLKDYFVNHLNDSCWQAAP